MEIILPVVVSLSGGTLTGLLIYVGLKAKEKKYSGYKAGSVDPNNQYTDNELKQLNQLYFCQVCDRYSRNHMLELDVLKRELETGRSGLRKCCPNCQSQSIYTAAEKYSWQENHRHCFKLKPEQYSEYKNDVQKWRNAIKDAEELRAFEEYESKHLANGPRQQPSDDLKKEEARHLISRFKNKQVLDSVEQDNVLIKEANGDIQVVSRAGLVNSAVADEMQLFLLMEEDGYEVYLLPNNRLMIHNSEKFKPPVSMADNRREAERVVRKNAQAEIDRAFDMQVYSRYEKGGVTMEEAAESLMAFRAAWEKSDALEGSINRQHKQIKSNIEDLKKYYHL